MIRMAYEPTLLRSREGRPQDCGDRQRRRGRAGWPHPCEVHAGGCGSIRLSKVQSIDQQMRLGMRCRLSPTADVCDGTSGAAMCRYCCKSRKLNDPKNLAKVDLWTFLL